MKLILYILLFLIYSCDDLSEQSGPLDYNGLISEGWSSFMQGDYDKSEEFFLNILEIDPSLVFYYSDAYLGLGWSAMYKAKNISGIDSTSFVNRFELRESAKEWFYEAIDEIDSYTGEAIGTDTIRYGHKIDILALPAPKVFLSTEGLKAVGPKAFGFDIEFKSIFKNE